MAGNRGSSHESGFPFGGGIPPMPDMPSFPGGYSSGSETRGRGSSTRGASRGGSHSGGGKGLEIGGGTGALVGIGILFALVEISTHGHPEVALQGGPVEPSMGDIGGSPINNPDTSPAPAPSAPVPTPPSPSHPASSLVEWPIPAWQLRSEGNGDAPLSKSEYYLDKWGPYFNQRDPAWYYQALGNSHVKLGSEGCVITDIAMIWDHLTGRNYGPQDVNAHKEWFNGPYIKAMPTLSGHQPVNFSKQGWMSEAQYNDFLKSKIKEGYSLIIEVPNGAGAWHYVVGHGVDSKGGIIINDPWYAWNVDVAGDWHWGTGVQGVMNATWAVGYK